jgi:phage shock protein E
MKTITRDQLKEKMSRGDTFALIELSGPEQFEARHLPGAIDVPFDEGFAKKVVLAVPDRSQTVVVYSRDAASEVLSRAADFLAKLGYREVLEYAAGKEDWEDAGLRVVHS